MKKQLELFDSLNQTEKRFWCRYDELEEYHAGMWRMVSDKNKKDFWLKKAVAFLSNSEEFRQAMRKVFKAWPISCRYNFTNPSLNKSVWLAHAGASLVHNIPEEFMRLGYWELSIPERERADFDASEIFKEWKEVC